MTLKPDSGAAAVAQLSPTMPGPRPGRFIYSTGDRPLEGYTIRRGVGWGGFGEVYYAVSDGGKEVALKLVQRNLEVELRGVTQCLNLKHTNLISLYDVRQSDRDECWIVMEYVNGETLSDAIARHPNGLPPAEVLHWMRGICDGIGYLHEQGIVHRDLKPGNIFIESGLVKIGDYGLSKFISASRRSGQTESVGTVHYMAPELSRGRYGKEIDLYALGVILYELLTGRVPFDGESPGEILMKHLTAEPDVSVLAGPYQALVTRLLAKAPEQRYPSAAAAMADVEAAVAGRPFGAAGDGGAAATHRAATPPPLPIPPIAGGHAGTRNATRAGKPVPFAIQSVHGGLTTVEGLLRFDGQALIFDIEVKPLGMFCASTDTVVVSLNDLDAVESRDHWMVTTITVCTSRPHHLDRLRGASLGRVVLVVSRANRPAAHELLAAVTTARGQSSEPQPQPRPIPLSPVAPAGGAYAESEPGLDERPPRLRRLATERKWAGVCAGLAAYYGIDPVWIRLLAIVAAFGSGLIPALLAYFVLTLVMSQEPAGIGLLAARLPRRRLCRPQDDCVWAGVCGGVAAYFGLDAVWVRLPVIALTFFTGIVPGLLIYWLLVFVMPRAASAATGVPWKTAPPNASVRQFWRVLVRMFVAASLGGGAGIAASVGCELIGGIWSGVSAVFIGAGTGLVVTAFLMSALCAALGRPFVFWPAVATLAWGAGIGLGLAGVLSAGRIAVPNEELVATFVGLGSGGVAAGLGGVGIYTLISKALRWRWVFLVLFLSGGVGFLTAGASVALEIGGELGALAAVGAGLLTFGICAALLLFGKLLDRMGASTLESDAAADGPAGNAVRESVRSGVSRRVQSGMSAMLIFGAVVGAALYSAMQFFRLNGVARPIAITFRAYEPATIVDAERDRLSVHTDRVTSLAFDRDSTLLASGDDSGKLLVWSLATPAAAPREFTGHQHGIQRIEFSSDGKRLVATGDCKDLRIWDVASAAEVGSPIMHQSNLRSATFSPDGVCVATGTDDDIVRLFDVATGTLVRQFYGCKGSVTAVRFAGSGTRLMAHAHGEGSVRIWNVASGRNLATIPFGRVWVDSVVMSPDGARFAVVDGSSIRVWNADTQESAGRIVARGLSSLMAFGAVANHILLNEDEGIALWDLTAGRAVVRFGERPVQASILAISPDGRHVAVGASDGTIRLWDVPEQARSHSIGSR